MDEKKQLQNPAFTACVLNMRTEDIFEDWDSDESSTTFRSRSSSECPSELDAPSGGSCLMQWRFPLGHVEGQHFDSAAAEILGYRADCGPPPGLPPPAPTIQSIWNHVAQDVADTGSTSPMRRKKRIAASFGSSGSSSYAESSLSSAAATADLEGLFQEAASAVPLPHLTFPMPRGLPPTRMVLWCEANPTNPGEILERLRGVVQDQRPQIAHFPTTTRFARWLFEQPRGEVNPYALLIAGWREAKPCAAALGAARTGNAAQLRPDARRPDLHPVVGNPAKKVDLAVAGMIVLLANSDNEARARAWATYEGQYVAGLEIHISSTTKSDLGDPGGEVPEPTDSKAIECHKLVLSL